MAALSNKNLRALVTYKKVSREVFTELFRSIYYTIVYIIFFTIYFISYGNSVRPVLSHMSNLHLPLLHQTRVKVITNSSEESEIDADINFFY